MSGARLRRLKDAEVEGCGNLAVAMAWSIYSHQPENHNGSPQN